MAPSPASQQQPGKRARDGSDADDDDNGLFVKSTKLDHENTTIESELLADVKQESQSDSEDDDADDADEQNGDGQNVSGASRDHFPVHPIFDDEIPKIEHECAEAVEEVVDIFDAHDCDTEAVREFRSKAKELQSGPKTKPVKVGMVGDSGVGKSSLCNSLYNIPGLAKEGAMGKACTAVASSHERPFAGQMRRFAAQVNYYAEQSIRQQMSEHIENYLTYHFRLDNGTTDQDRLMYQKRAKQALQAFTTVLCDQVGFKSEQAIHQTLSLKQDDTPGLTKNILAACNALISARGATRNHDHYEEYHEADSMSELKKLLDPATTPTVKPTEPSVWPLVEDVKLAETDCSWLAEFIGILDMPGVSDTNLVRAGTALVKIKGCEFLMFVGPTKRVITDPTVEKMIQRYKERFANRMFVVSTGCEPENTTIDGLNALTDDLENHGYGFADYRRLSGQIKTNEQKMERYEKELEAAK